MKLILENDIPLDEQGCALFMVPEGTVVHIEGIPLKLIGDTWMRTHPENGPLIERLAAERSDAPGVYNESAGGC